MKRKFLTAILLTLTIILSTVLGTGCEYLGISQKDPVSIVSIEKTSTDGLIDTYTITYSDGTTSTFEITNGKDGLDGQDLDLYESYLDFIEQTQTDVSFADFIKEYVSFEVNETSKSQVATNLLRSVAKVSTAVVEKTEKGKKYYGMYSGSSVIYRIDQDYTYFITNYHVVYGEKAESQNKLANDFYVYLYGAESSPSYEISQTLKLAYNITYDKYAIPCTFVGGSASADIALIRAETAKVKEINPDIKAITFADGYEVGQTAIAIGNPNDDGISVTKGVISVDGEMVTLSVGGSSREFRSLRIDTSIYPGSSGGGLFDENGKLIAITNGGNTEDEHVNYAIPLGIVKGVADGLYHYSKQGLQATKKLYLGINVNLSEFKYKYDQQTGVGYQTVKLTVSSLDSNLPASKMGLAVGDVVTALNINGVSYKVNMNYDIGDLMYTIRTGDRIYFEVESRTIDSSYAYTVQSSDLVAVE